MDAQDFQHIKTTISIPKFLLKYLKHNKQQTSNFLQKAIIQNIKETNQETYNFLKQQINEKAQHRTKTILKKMFD